jgi:two-component system sensor histidine kinase KdpD
VQSRRRVIASLLALAAVAAVTLAARAMHLNANTVGFAFLIVVLLASLRGGLLAGAVTSIVATLSYNYFFFPPLHTFTIQDPANWVALAAFLITSVVVSRLAHLEALRESEALKTSILRAISHDLTTPMTAIGIKTESLKRMAGADAELRDAVNGIDDETQRLRRRIENLLSMARLEAGKTVPRREPTPAADLFHAARENLPLVFQSRPVIVRVGDDCPDANVDPSLALEILANLIENADRVSPAGAPLELIASRHPDDPSRVRLEIRDRGPGAPAGAITDLAQRGLGLEIARSFAAANGGSIALEPRDGGGTIAIVDLPAART